VVNWVISRIDRNESRNFMVEGPDKGMGDKMRLDSLATAQENQQQAYRVRVLNEMNNNNSTSNGNDNGNRLIPTVAGGSYVAIEIDSDTDGEGERESRGASRDASPRSKLGWARVTPSQSHPTSNHHAYPPPATIHSCSAVNHYYDIPTASMECNNYSGDMREAARLANWARPELSCMDGLVDSVSLAGGAEPRLRIGNRVVPLARGESGCSLSSQSMGQGAGAEKYTAEASGGDYTSSADETGSAAMVRAQNSNWFGGGPSTEETSGVTTSGGGGEGGRTPKREGSRRGNLRRSSAKWRLAVRQIQKNK